MQVNCKVEPTKEISAVAAIALKFGMLRPRVTQSGFYTEKDNIVYVVKQGQGVNGFEPEIYIFAKNDSSISLTIDDWAIPVYYSFEEIREAVEGEA